MKKCLMITDFMNDFVPYHLEYRYKKEIKKRKMSWVGFYDMTYLQKILTKIKKDWEQI